MSESYEYHFKAEDGEIPAQTVTPEPPKKKGSAGRIIALALVCALLGGAIGAGGFALGSASAAPKSSSTVQVGQREKTVIDVKSVDTGKLMTEAEVYAANVNSTVGITTMVTTNFWGYQTQSPASGSGFILTQDGYILTNYHVIEDSDSITVSLYDGSTYDGTVIGYDESNDIAVLKVEAEGLQPVVIGDSDNINVGDPVLAIGNPLGELTFSLTGGRVSALNREITMSGGATMNLLQTDCAINAGNSGGALFNLYGEVVGITNAKYSSSGASGEASIDNIGFAIPVNQVMNIVQSIIEKGYITKPYIGVTVMTVSTEAISYGLPAGASVQSVVEDAPAEKAGLQTNDIIYAVDGQEISSSSDLVDLVGKAAPGDTLTLSVYRQGEKLELTVEIGEQTQSALPEETEEQPQQQMDQQQLPSGIFPFFGW